MRRFWFLIPVLVACAVACQAPAPPAADADPHAALRSELEAAMVEAIKAQNVPGAVAAIILPDGSEIELAVGCQDRACTLKMEPDDRMLGGSTGKSFAGATALALEAEGRLDLDAPVAQVLSDAAWLDRLPNGKTITLRQLLTHSSGLDDYVHNPAALAFLQSRAGPPPQASTPEELIAFSFDRPALFEPGKGFAYTDTGYLIAGLAIEKATGQEYYDLARQYFLEPLRLDRTAPSVELKLDRLVPGHADAAEAGPLVLPPVMFDAAGALVYHPKTEWTGGGFSTNARDLARWARAYCGGEAIKGDYLKELEASRVSVDAARTYSFGLGFETHPKLGPVCEHSGWIPGYLSSFAHYGDRGVSAAVQLNSIGSAAPGGDAPAANQPDAIALQTRLAEIAAGSFER